MTVFYDEIDLAAGKVRVKTGGGTGGHNGIRSLDQHIGNNYRRVRIGVGHPGVKEMVHGHVLGDFAKADREWLDAAARRDRRQCRPARQGRRQRLHEQDHARRCATSSSRTGESDRPPPKEAKSQSHIRQARQQKPQVKLPETGPMAAMLKKLFGKD